MSERRQIRFRWSEVQGRILNSTARFIDAEGAIRSGKTTVGIMKAVTLAWNHPGMQLLLARWTDGMLKAQLKPRFYELCPREYLKGSFNAAEGYQDLLNGSRIYMRSLKSVDEAGRFGKFSGLTLSFILLDQAEEVPGDVYEALTGRLSQPGYPQQILLLPNPPANDHWLAKEFPEDPALLTPDHAFFRLTLYDNALHLDPKTIQGYEQQYPVGSMFRRRFIEGRRGLTSVGDPVYRGYFRRDTHVRPVKFTPGTPLLRSWDFGHRHPAVLWAQFLPSGQWRVLKEYQGDAQFIDDFAPTVDTMTHQYFPDATECWDCADPAGGTIQGHGMRRTAMDVLRDLDIYPRTLLNSNDPIRRDFAIQQIARALMRWGKDGPMFLVDPSCPILIDGMEAGYVWEEIKRTGTTVPNTRRPKKDGYYDHLQNTLEYLMLNFGGLSVMDWKERRRTAREASRERRAALDLDEPFQWDTGRRLPLSRAGY